MASAISDRAPIPTTFLWAVPRSLSTALLLSFSQLPHTATCLEPFWEGSLAEGKHPDPEHKILTHDEVLEGIATGSYLVGEDKQIVAKVITSHISLEFFKKILSAIPHAKHLFLLRNPYYAIPSTLKAMAASSTSHKESYLDRKYIEEDVSLSTHYQVFEHLREQGQDPAVVDMDEFLEHPHMMTKEICKALDMPFTEALLSWEAGVFPSSWDHPIRHFEGWVGSLSKSEGWVPRSPPPIDVEKLSDMEREMAEDLFPLYQKMSSYKIALPK